MLRTPWMAYLLIVDVCMQRISSWRYLMLDLTTCRGFSSIGSTKKHIRTCLHSSNRSPWPRCRCVLLCRLCRSCLNLQKFLWPLDLQLFFHRLFSAFSIFTQDFQYQATGMKIYLCDVSLRTKPASEWSITDLDQNNGILKDGHGLPISAIKS